MLCFLVSELSIYPSIHLISQTWAHNQNYKVFAAKEFKIKNDRYFHGYLLGSEINQKKLPIDANPRKPSPTKVVKMMQATMVREPNNFHHLNNGMTVIASDLIYDEQNKEIIIYLKVP